MKSPGQAGRSSNTVRTRRSGSIYVFVLVTAMLVSLIGVSAIYLGRVNIRQARSVEDQSDAMTLAASAVEAGLAAINNNHDWRACYFSGIETPRMAFGSGTISWKLVDEDGDLAGDTADPLRLYGIGRTGSSAWCYSVLLRSADPMDLLNTCIHSGGQLHIRAGKTLEAIGAPASTNANFLNEGVLLGDIEAATGSGSGTVTGDVTIPSDEKAMPFSSAMLGYIAKATVLPYVGDMHAEVLSPGVNDYAGLGNPDGIYYINSAGNDLKIANSRINGTLIVDVGSRTLYVDNAVYMRSYRSNYPVLIVKGNLVLSYSSDGVMLDESDCLHNFNPDGAPYNGHSDYDCDDVYPSEICGLVHCTGDLLLKQTCRVRGVVICNSSVTVEDSPQIRHDPSIPQNPPDGYTSAEGELTVAAGSWQREPLQ